MVAIDRFIVFTALALHERPDWAEKIQAGMDKDVESFVLEVRRFYPFFPVIGGKVVEEFDWKPHSFMVGRGLFSISTAPIIMLPAGKIRTALGRSVF
ncbi:hypothetical protein CWR43_19160 [Rhizobium sullae]|uniref:Uncharacterized protein n=2 Tax=Rhizobium sullae TaxID=50338 RepID=A0A2N0D7Z0_RHISU|nr:hypothetical protein CWR43_19160 [Rhizobium sullae]